MSDKYDLIMSLGETCTTSGALRELNLQTESLPFDWSAGVIPEKCGACGLSGKIKLINNKFKDAFEYGDLKEFPCNDGNAKFRNVRNLKTGLQYIHEFPFTYTLKEHFKEYQEKYERRVKRFYQKVKNAKNILFVFIIRSKQNLHLSEILDNYEILKRTFPNKKIDFFLMKSVDYMDKFQTSKLKINDNIMLTFFNDTPMHPTNPLLGNMCIIKKSIMEQLDKYYISFGYEDITQLGLAEKEGWGRWTQDSICIMQLNLPSTSKNYEFNFKISPFLCKERKSQSVKVFANNREVANWNFKENNFPKTSFEVYDISQVVQFKFLIKEPISPTELGISKDCRKLGIGFISLTISEIN